jgi:outer membrane immunogenic protein
MKNLSSAVVAAAILGSSVVTAVAADLPKRTVAPAIAVAPAFNWTGFRVGLQGGWAGGGEDVFGYINNVPGVGSFRNLGDLSPNGGYIGAHLGYDYQFAGTPIVAGLMAEGNFTFMDRTVRAVRGATRLIGETEVEWDASIRARLGYSFGRVMIYGTGGLAFAQVDATTRSTAPVVTGASRSTNHFGFTVGGGLEYAVTNNLILGVEYRYTQLELKTLRGTGPLATSFTRSNVTPNWHRVGASVAWKF